MTVKEWAWVLAEATLVGSLIVTLAALMTCLAVTLICGIGVLFT